MKWIILAMALLMIALVACIAQAAAPEPRIQAEPPAESEVTFDMDKNRAYTAEDGVVIVPASYVPDDSPELVPMAVTPSAIGDTPEAALLKAVAPSGGYTMPEQAQMADGSIGVLSIPKLGLTVGVFETDDEMEAMSHGLAHFKTTSAWQGNIGLCGHNVNFDLTDGYLKNLHTLKIGDSISYKTALGSRTYTVETVTEIAETDWSWLGRTEDNKITLITCISGKSASRLMVRAAEK